MHGWGQPRGRPGLGSASVLAGASLAYIPPVGLSSPEKNRPGSEGHVPPKPTAARGAPEAAPRQEGETARRQARACGGRRAEGAVLVGSVTKALRTRVQRGEEGVGPRGCGSRLGSPPGVFPRRKRAGLRAGAEAARAGLGPRHRRAARRPPRAPTRGQLGKQLYCAAACRGARVAGPQGQAPTRFQHQARAHGTLRGSRPPEDALGGGTREAANVIPGPAHVPRGPSLGVMSNGVKPNANAVQLE